MASPTATWRRTIAVASGALAASVTGCLGGSSDGPTFDHPDSVRADEPFEMTIADLPAATPVEVTAESSTGLEASAVVETDADGRLDLARAIVVDGDVPNDLEVPTTVALLQFGDESFWEYRPPTAERLTYAVAADGDRLGATELRRRHADREAGVEPEHDELVGPVFDPADGGDGPGVLVLHGSDGRPLVEYALALAQRGFTAFALRYFSGPGLPDDLAEIPLEYVETAADWLLDRETVVGDRVGALGMSRGGELALLAGSEFDAIGAVVSVVGSGLVWEGGDTLSDEPRTSTWSLDGEPVPHVPFDAGDLEDESAASGREYFAASLEAASTTTLADATIPLEEIDGDAVLVSAGDDELWPTGRLHGFAVDRLADGDRSAVDHRRYADAGHGIVPPYAPVRGTVGGRYGGSLAGNALASHDHWPRVVRAFSDLE